MDHTMHRNGLAIHRAPNIGEREHHRPQTTTEKHTVPAVGGRRDVRKMGDLMGEKALAILSK